MTRTRHQRTIAEPVQKFIDPVEAVEHAELLRDPLPQVFGASDTVMRIRCRLIEMGSDDRFLGVGQVPMIPAPSLIPQPLETVFIVSLDPGLDRSPADSRQFGHLRCGMTSLRQDHGLQPPKTRRTSLTIGEASELLHGMVFCNMHGDLLVVIAKACHINHAGATLTGA